MFFVRGLSSAYKSFQNAFSSLSTVISTEHSRILVPSSPKRILRRIGPRPTVRHVGEGTKFSTWHLATSPVKDEPMRVSTFSYGRISVEPFWSQHWNFCASLRVLTIEKYGWSRKYTKKVDLYNVNVALHEEHPKIALYREEMLYTVTGGTMWCAVALSSER